MYAIVQKRNILFTVSLLLLVPGIVALAVWGIRLGIDFTGGSVLLLSIPQNPSAERLTDVAKGLSAGDVRVRQTSDGAYELILRPLTPEEHAKVLADLRESFENIEETSFETVGPTIGAELRQRSIVATVLVLVGILLYVTWAFRKVSSGPVPSWVYGVSTVVALAHDVVMVVGIFAILGRTLGLVVDTLFVTALLTVLGFSVHDTIVVFDRIRERLRLTHAATFEATVNESLNQTLVRSLNTSLTTLLVLLALYLFGGASIRTFTLALLIGITSGTYSSIFIASPLLVVWHNWKRRR